ncbi:MAG: hypothetical protein WBE38_21900 [Terracidiphilus sp.]|jgi:hypothetical protein
MSPQALRSFWSVALLTAVSIVVLVLAIVSFHNVIPITFDGRTVLILGIAAALIFASIKVFFSGGDRVASVRYVVAFDAIVIIILGVAATVLACSRWQTAALLAGSSLMIGGFVGLLFGYPQGVAQKTAAQTGTAAAATPPAGNGTGQAANGVQDPGQGAANTAITGPPNAPAPIRPQNLVAESAATLGKVITGFTLAKVGGMSDFFSKLSNQIGPALGSSDPATAPVLAGVIIAYFLAAGFLCGLFLPPYFMGEVL